MMMLDIGKTRNMREEKVKKITINEGSNNNKTLVSCSNALYHCYIILGNMCLFYEELHL
jgi:hypothetical protein